MRENSATPELLHPPTDKSRDQVVVRYAPPDVAPPVGAEPDLWTAGGVRDVYAIIGHIPTSPDLLRCPAVTVIAEQRRNGTIGAVDIDVDARAGLSAAQARELAALLIAGADLADKWVTR
jgi:hypothetical protein